MPTSCSRFKERSGIGARPSVFLEELLERRLEDARALHHRRFDDVVDVEEVDGALEEGADGDLIGRVEDAGHRAAHLAGLIGEAQSLERVGVRLLEGQVLELPEVEALEVGRLARRIRQGVLDWQLHVRAAELRDDGAVAELDHRVDDALRVDDDLDLVIVDTVEPLRLDDLKALVDERGRVDRDLLPHIPRRMREDLRLRRADERLALLAAERAARTGQEQLLDRLALLALQALEKGAVLTVDRQNGDALLLRAAHDDLAGDDERLLVGERDVLLGVERLHRRLEAGKAHHRGHDRVDGGIGRRIDERLTAAGELRLARVARLEARVGRLVGEHGELRLKLADLLFEQFIARIGSEHGDVEELAVAAHDVERLRADGARGA